MEVYRVKMESIGFNLFMPKLSDIRKKSITIEERLKEHFFTPFSILPIPDEAPEDIPRIIAKSKNGHSDISISLINAKLHINFDDNFNTDIEKCFVYIKEKIDKLVDIFGEYSSGKFIFSGITSRVVIDCEHSPIDFLNSKFLNVKSDIIPYNISNKFTYLLEDTYYLNFNIYNLRTFEATFSEVKLKPDIKESGHYLTIEIDMNDKHGYNHNVDYLCTKQSIYHIINSVKYNINTNINNILEGRNLVL